MCISVCCDRIPCASGYFSFRKRGGLLWGGGCFMTVKVYTCCLAGSRATLRLKRWGEGVCVLALRLGVVSAVRFRQQAFGLDIVC